MGIRSQMNTETDRGVGAGTEQSDRDGWHRVHRICHVETAGTGRRTRAIGVPSGGAASFAGNRALPTGPDESGCQFAPRRHPAYRYTGRAPGHQRHRLCVRDAGAAFRRALDLGAWDIPAHARAVELNIPAIHGVGESLIYFVDRYDEFSIFDIDFRAIPGVDPNPPAINAMHYFGLVQYASRRRPYAGLGRVLFAGFRLSATAGHCPLRHHAQNE